MRHAIPDTRWPTREQAARALLFQPIRIGHGLELSQRTWVPAMVPWRASETGDVTKHVLEWYGRMADGQPGALVVEATGIRDIPSGPLLRIGHDRFVPGLARLVEEVDRRSKGQTKLLIQLIDFLAIKRRPPPDRYFKEFLKLEPEHRRRLAEVMAEGASAAAPAVDWEAAPEAAVRQQLRALAEDSRLERILSARELEDLRMGHRERITDMHLPHIRNLPQVLPELFAGAARRAEQAGFAGVELHFAHAYTLASFLSALNDRDDGYGGTREARLRLPMEVYQATRAALGPITAVGCRFLGDEAVTGGSNVEDAIHYAVRFAVAGMDFLSLSKGGKFEDARQPKVGSAAYPYTGPSGHECMPTIYADERGPFGRNLHLARAVRLAVRAAGLSTPVIAAGGINTFELAETALLRGDADVIASARQSLADPDWFLKVRMGRGDEIRRCAMTNYCEGLDQQHKQVTCRLWDREVATGGEVALSSDGKRRLVAPRWLIAQDEPS